MNSHLLRNAFRQQYRKRGFQIAAIVHVIAIIVLFFFLSSKSEVLELDDEIQVDIYELPKQSIAKKETIPILKETPKPKQEVPIPRKQIILQKNVIQPKPAVDIAKIPGAAPAEVALQSEAVNKRSDADIPPALDAPDLSTDVKLTASAESILSPTASDTGTSPTKSYGRREGTGVRSPGKGTGIGKGLNIKSTGTADGVAKIGKIGTGAGGGGSPFGNTIKNLAEDIIEKSDGAPIDVVFVVDASGSMGDNIRAVTQHLGEMIDVYEKVKTDYHLGLTSFYAMKPNDRSNVIRVYPLTTNLSAYKHKLDAIRAIGGWQNAPDAMHQTVKEMRFRPNSAKHFILATDEPFTSAYDYSVHDTIRLCKRSNIYAHVLGLRSQEHQYLASETGGTWHAIPQDTIVQKPPTPISNPYTSQTISKAILKDAVNMPVDIILFIDSSKSMENKKPQLTQRIDLWLRDWDNALIDYRVGVVRFRASGGINMVNVFNPPQTQKQLHKILQLPCRDNENLLQAVVDSTRRLKRRPNAKTHLILITDEPGNPKDPIAGTIKLLKEMSVVVHVIGTSDTFQQQVAQQTGGIWVAMPNGHKMDKPNH